MLAVDRENFTDDLFWLELRTAEEFAADGRIEEARNHLSAALAAGLDAPVGELALLLDPRLGPSERRELYRVLDEQ